MESTQNNLSQKEYLKKYFSKDKGKKKKVKVSSSSHIKRSVIIDDDLGLPSNATIDDEEFNLEYLGDEAPQIAGIIDERPPEVKAKESYGDPNRWKSINGTEENTFIKNLIGKLSSQNANKTENSLDNSDGIVSKELISRENDKFRDSEFPKKSKKDGKRSADAQSLKGRIKDLDDYSPTRKNSNSKRQINHSDDSDLSPPRNSKMEIRHDSNLPPPQREFTIGKKTKYASDSGSDFSPPRNKNGGNHMEYQNKKSKKHKDDSDSDSCSLRGNKRRVIEKKSDRHRHSRSGSDLSPPRWKDHRSKEKRKDLKNNNNSEVSLPRRREKDYQSRERHKSKNSNSDSDLSPPRRKGRDEKSKDKLKGYKNNSDSDLSPPRRKGRDEKSKDKPKGYKNSSDSDLSPPRRKRRDEKSKDKLKGYKNSSDSDLSPPRRKGRNERSKEKHKGYKNSSDSDLSPPRKKGRDYKTKDNHKHSDNDSDLSPPRRKNYGDKNSKTTNNHCISNRNNSESDLSPPRKHREKYDQREDSRKLKKLDKTLDGKKAGLQSAKNLKDELKKLRDEEDAAFSKMQASVSGENASAVVRDRKTGKIRDLEKEKQELVKKSAKSIEHEKKYAKWGKGLKQIEDAEERVAYALHEMNKPLARYAGDDDLEQMLKERIRDEDPSLQFIKNAQAESINVDNIGKPKYQGHFMPNRFGIRPGHRWDGVERSNGYEQKWFERQNAHKAIQKEAYKWSTSDM